MAVAVGPTSAGGFESFTIDDDTGEEYVVTLYPDRENDALQREGKASVFYWIPGKIRLARTGRDFKFRHIHFVGVFDEASVGIEAGETQGGVVSFTTTSRLPVAILKKVEAELLRRFSGRDEKYWGIRTQVAPMLRIVPIVSNVTSLSNIFPGAEEQIAGGGAQPGGAGGPGAGPGAGPANEVSGGAPGGGGEPGGGEDPMSDPGMEEGPKTRGAITRSEMRRPVPHGAAFRAPSAINPWAMKVFGAGPGAITGEENAYSALLGPLASEVIWAGFHGSYSPLVVAQHMRISMWSDVFTLRIVGNWRRIYDHFSAHASGRYMWFSADIKAEFNNLRTSGDIKVELLIDGTVPGAERIQQEVDKRIDAIVSQFTDLAKKVIFDAPSPQTEAAQASSGGGLFGGLWGAGLALKYKHDQTSLELRYEETRAFRYFMEHTPSSSMEGFYHEIKADPQAEKKYFTRLVLGGLGRKVLRIIKPVVDWQRAGTSWVGMPVAFISCQIGYPGAQGQVQWLPKTFQASDPVDSTWRPAFIERQRDEVTNPPAEWDPGETFVKRKVHFSEPPSENAYPFVKMIVERNTMDLDPPTGTLSDENVLEVRADDVGMLDAGPLAIDAELGAPGEVVEVEMRAKGRRFDGTDRLTRSTRFRFNMQDQLEPRFWRVFTGQAEFVPAYQYRVHVTIKGSLFSKGQAWSGPWVDVTGNGALMVRVPAPDDEGVVMRSLVGRELFTREMVRAIDAPETGADAMPPISTPAGEPAEIIEPPQRYETAPPVPMGQTEAPRSRERGPQGYEVRTRKPRVPQKAGKTRGSGQIDSPSPMAPVGGTDDGWVEFPAGAHASGADGMAPRVDELDGVNRAPAAPVG